ncbi:glutamate-gated chloride channel [Trichonephila clavata]|uniref:Glutamate-gated chloride channel n=1 Tax=Trichonephila clavata TaxID=2740835 RepID=A0A8X6HR31_TRICU|nr:glutamate-gated chloride channel [Trichonephila clavata]
MAIRSIGPGSSLKDFLSVKIFLTTTLGKVLYELYIRKMKLLCYFILWLLVQVSNGNISQHKKNTLDKMLKNYEASVRPFMSGTSDFPTKVSVNIFITDIFDISDVKMDYVVQMYLREIWDDPRLRYPDPEGTVQSIPLGSIAKIWTPDLFFNEREGHFHHIQKANRFVRIFPTGKVSYSSRLTLKMHCPMNFKYFPFDRQICSFELESYGFETKDVSLKWVDGNAIQVNSKLHMSNFILEDFVAGYCDKPTKHGHGCLSIKLQMKRQYGYYLTQIFVPFVLLVAVSWLSLWLDARAVILRLALILVLLFMMIMISIELQSLIPAVSYTKAIDIWIAVCISLVFATLLQFILVNQLARRERRVRISENHATKNGGCKRNGKQKTYKMQTILEKCAHHQIPLSKRIDFVCRVLFPVAFVIFNCIFWFTYIKGRDSRHIIK